MLTSCGVYARGAPPTSLTVLSQWFRCPRIFGGEPTWEGCAHPVPERTRCPLTSHSLGRPKASRLHHSRRTRRAAVEQVETDLVILALTMSGREACTLGRRSPSQHGVVDLSIAT